MADATERNEDGMIAAPLPAELPLEEDLEAKYKKLESEKENYRQAYLKADKENKELRDRGTLSEDDKINEAVDRRIAESRLAEIAREQDALLSKALKENKELKLAQLNKPATPPAAIGSHSESPRVSDNLVTEDQLAALKARGWNDKKIEMYKKNLLKKR